MKFCDECGAKLGTSQKFCPECGKSLTASNNQRQNQKKKSSVGSVLALTFIIVVGCIVAAVAIVNNEESNYLSKDQYSELDVQQLHSDYINNEISAKDKYEGNYYFIKAKVYKVQEFLNDNYLEFMYRYDKDKNKQIEITAYFKNEDDLKSVNKDDEVTVYCKFKHRSVDNYMGVTTSYSLDYCQFINE